LPGSPNNLVKRITQSTLLVDQARRVIHNVHEQNVPNLELDLCLDLSGHFVTRANACAFHSMDNRWLYERRDQNARLKADPLTAQSLTRELS